MALFKPPGILQSFCGCHTHHSIAPLGVLHPHQGSYSPSGVFIHRTSLPHPGFFPHQWGFLIIYTVLPTRIFPHYWGFLHSLTWDVLLLGTHSPIKDSLTPTWIIQSYLGGLNQDCISSSGILGSNCNLGSIQASCASLTWDSWDPTILYSIPPRTCRICHTFLHDTLLIEKVVVYSLCYIYIYIFYNIYKLW